MIKGYIIIFDYAGEYRNFLGIVDMELEDLFIYWVWTSQQFANIAFLFFKKWSFILTYEFSFWKYLQLLVRELFYSNKENVLFFNVHL